MIGIILAGGIGKRFWPLSTPQTPKQFLKIFYHNNSLFDLTYDRLIYSEIKEIFTVTNKKYSKFIENYKINGIYEPFGRNTLGAFVLAIKKLYDLKKEKETVIFLPSDHIILDKESFKNDIKNAAKTVKKNKISVIIGIKPDYPETGFGYIKTSRLINEKISLYGVKGFKEKPDKQLAKYYFTISGYYWNCGIIVTTPEILLEELKIHNKYIYNFIKNNDYDEIVKNFEKIPNLPVEKAIIEKSRRVAMIKAGFDWSDLGSWGSYFKYIKKTSQNVKELNSSGNNVLTTKKTVLIDIEGITVIESENGILVMKNESYQKLKDIL